MSGTEDKLDEFDIPIAVWKGLRSCTQHPLSNFVRYDHLSNSVRALVSNMACIQIPKDILKALKDPQWKKVVMEEMEAPKKIETRSIVKKP